MKWRQLKAMIVNAYKVNINLRKNENRSISQIVKELSSKVVKEERELIESNNKQNLLEKIKLYLYDLYEIKEDKTIQSIEEEILNRIYGYGILQKHINNELVSDVRVTRYNMIFIKEKGIWKKVQDEFESKEEFEEFVRFCALKNAANINFETPIIVFSDKKNSLRIEAGIEPANVDGPSLVIRIHRKNTYINLEKLFVEYNMLDKESYKLLKLKIDGMSNIILCGKGGSGKTTLLKTLINKMPKNIAITTNEETAELYLENRNVIQRECILNRSEEKNIDLEKLSRHSLVMSNDVIIIGELKGAEASAFFDSISTGHTGLATVHADCAKNAIDRLITLIKKDPKSQYYTEGFLQRFLASSIDYIVFMQEFKVNEVLKINYDNKEENIEFRELYKLR